jgi:haloacetate dehalogenase
MSAFFPGFRVEHADLAEVRVRYRIGGSGPPLLLLHGFPQTHAMWHHVAPRLAQAFTVVAPDLRGYGGSSRPATTEDHEPYSKRAMARDQVALMAKLGFERFAVAGHDRGGRVAYRLALDHRERVTRLAVLDILPTGEHYRRADAAFARGYFHWFFMVQPAPLPERLIAADPELFYKRSRNTDFFAPEALADYRAFWAEPEAIHAMCEDYRAGIGIDWRLDEADRGQRKIACAMLALWGAQNLVGQIYDPLAVWRDWADDVSGRALDCGHYLPEEKPEETYEALAAFFA